MSSTLQPLAEVLAASRRTLLIVNSHSADQAEIDNVVSALEANGGLVRVAAMAPAALCPALARRGIAATAILPFELEIGFFLQSDCALQWAVRQSPDLIVGSEPYAPNNEEVKTQFELRVAPMLGAGRLVAQGLPDDRAMLFTAEDLWRRAARQEAVAAHRDRVAHALERLHQTWSADPEGGSPATAGPIAAEALRVTNVENAPEPASVIEASRWSYDRLHGALQSDGGYPVSTTRMLTDPAGATPRAGWIGKPLDPIRRPSQLDSRARWRGQTLSFRGTAAEPYGYLLMSRPVHLNRGDAVMAEGRVYHGGVTIGLVRNDAWSSRVDIIDRIRFIATAVVTEPGPHALVVAHCLQGAGRRSAIAIRRLGFRRAET